MLTTNDLDNPAEFLLHKQPMLLISGISAYTETTVDTYVNLDASSLFANPDGSVASWVGIEYMAQTIGIYAGIHAKKAGQAIKLGFLLGTRKYQSFTSYFTSNARLLIHAECLLLGEDGLTLFDCSIRDEHNHLLAQADVKAIQPENPQIIFENS